MPKCNFYYHRYHVAVFVEPIIITVSILDAKILFIGTVKSLGYMMPKRHGERCETEYICDRGRKTFETGLFRF